MPADRRPDDGFLETLRDIPPDLSFILVLIGLTLGAVFLPWVRETYLRVLLGLPLVLFIPGYVFIAALFPESGTTETESDMNERTPSETDSVAETTATIEASEGGIDGVERVALSFGTSIAIVPLVGLILNFTPWGIQLIPIMVSLTVLVLGLTWFAVQRRRALPPAVRFQVPYRRWLTTGRRELFEPDTRRDGLLNVVMVCSVLLATASVGYAVAVPNQGESFSEFYLLTETEDGELIADNYPQEFNAGENRTLTVGIGNQEYESASYSVLVVVQDVTIENNSTRVLSQQQLRRFQADVAHNETWHRQHTVAPTMTGENLRLTYLLYRGSPPAEPSTDNAYRELHVQISVAE